jgi:hypothetical protein
MVSPAKVKQIMKKMFINMYLQNPLPAPCVRQKPTRCRRVAARHAPFHGMPV